MIHVALLAAVLFASQAESPAPPPPERPAGHETRTVEGWTVRVDRRLLEGDGKAVGDHALRLLANRLYEIAFVLPADKVERLRKIAIQIDLSYADLVSAQYHVSADWLREHGHDPALARCVHIPDAGEWSSRRHQVVQPWSVLHELSHAYHDQVLGFDEPAIVAAWERFRDDPRSGSALHVDGETVEHYGRTDQMEFFAEMTEAYFGVNDFAPFNRGQLATQEPEAHALMAKVWGGT
jgi:hypothetical protein